MSNLLKLGLPAGSLQDATGELFRKAGYKIAFASRSWASFSKMGATTLETNSISSVPPLNLPSPGPTLVKRSVPT